MRFTHKLLCTAVRAFTTAAAAAQRVSPALESPPARPPTEVGVVTLKTQAVSLPTELPGRTTASLSSDVRPQVNGIIQSRLFVEGGDVRKGQALYQIDPAPYRATLDQAKAHQFA